MSIVATTMKLRLYTDNSIDKSFKDVTQKYTEVCNYISQYVFDHNFPLNSVALQKELYQTIRSEFNFKAQMTISSFKTVTARYETVKEQLFRKPYKYTDENGKTIYITRTLEWLWKPICFSRPQADFVRGRDYSFLSDGETVSINTLGKRVKVRFEKPDCFKQYFDDPTYSFGTAKLVSLNGIWYLHIPVSREVKDTDPQEPKHVVGIDRGLRFLTVSYDEKGKTIFTDGKQILEKREKYNEVRAQLQAKGTKSAKRVLKRISGRENRWMSDINHQMSKALVKRYGTGTLFVLEDLTDVSFNEETLQNRTKEGRQNLRTWTFYQFEQDLKYKAALNGSNVLTVSASYTSQRCPKCGRINKSNRHHDTHEYICDCCGYRSNDDRIGAMNIYTLGTMYVSGDTNPKFGKRKN